MRKTVIELCFAILLNQQNTMIALWVCAAGGGVPEDCNSALRQAEELEGGQLCL